MPKLSTKNKLPRQESKAARRASGEHLAGCRDARKASLPPCQALLESYAAKLTPVDTSLRNSHGCDGEGTTGTYGSLTFQAQLRVTWDLMAHGELPTGPGQWRAGAEPVVVDFGAGTGRALVLWQGLNLVARAIGYEIDEAKVEKAPIYMSRLLTSARYEVGLPLRTDGPLPKVLLQDVAQLLVTNVAALRPTVGYSFCAGIPPEGKMAMGDIFLACPTMKVLVLVDYGLKPLTALKALAGTEDLEEVERLFTYRTVNGLRAMGGNGSYRAIIVTKKADKRAAEEAARAAPWMTAF